MENIDILNGNQEVLGQIHKKNKGDFQQLARMSPSFFKISWGRETMNPKLFLPNGKNVTGPKSFMKCNVLRLIEDRSYVGMTDSSSKVTFDASINGKNVKLHFYNHAQFFRWATVMKGGERNLFDTNFISRWKNNPAELMKNSNLDQETFFWQNVANVKGKKGFRKAGPFVETKHQIGNFFVWLPIEIRRFYDWSKINQRYRTMSMEEKRIVKDTLSDIIVNDEDDHFVRTIIDVNDPRDVPDRDRIDLTGLEEKEEKKKKPNKRKRSEKHRKKKDGKKTKSKSKNKRTKKRRKKETGQKKIPSPPREEIIDPMDLEEPDQESGSEEEKDSSEDRETDSSKDSSESANSDRGMVSESKPGKNVRPESRVKRFKGIYYSNLPSTPGRNNKKWCVYCGDRIKGTGALLSVRPPYTLTDEEKDDVHYHFCVCNNHISTFRGKNVFDVMLDGKEGCVEKTFALLHTLFGKKDHTLITLVAFMMKISRVSPYLENPRNGLMKNPERNIRMLIQHLRNEPFADFTGSDKETILTCVERDTLVRYERYLIEFERRLAEEKRNKERS